MFNSLEDLDHSAHHKLWDYIILIIVRIHKAARVSNENEPGRTDPSIPVFKLVDETVVRNSLSLCFEI